MVIRRESPARSAREREKEGARIIQSRLPPRESHSQSARAPNGTQLRFSSRRPPPEVPRHPLSQHYE
ncbi:hypothetical protein JTE90_001889 [Oedothorax gibbosus]|uniref:Uncharacterized protein n=1 Tax=Oedothorax gibbosus TaxID=931172 RepID=A0AAV6VNK3_9ARAC|nr:hypothetical protein JTE90_001889 [Oedothorax gibbosus]